MGYLREDMGFSLTCPWACSLRLPIPYSLFPIPLFPIPIPSPFPHSLPHSPPYSPFPHSLFPIPHSLFPIPFAQHEMPLSSSAPHSTLAPTINLPVASIRMAGPVDGVAGNQVVAVVDGSLVPGTGGITWGRWVILG